MNNSVTWMPSKIISWRSDTTPPTQDSGATSTWPSKPLTAVNSSCTPMGLRLSSIRMKKRICIVITSLFMGSWVWAARRAIAVGQMLEKTGADQTLNKPQIARDLEGLDPKEGAFSKGLRGSFTVKHYIQGPWAGGTAVIEVASDLSYAEIRIFDQENNLQRIYSILPKSQNSRIDPTQMGNPLEMVRQGRGNTAPSSNESMNVTRSREREAAVQAQTTQAVQDRAVELAEAAPQVRPGNVSSRAGDIREGSTSEAIEAYERAEARPKRRVIRVRRKR